MANEIEPPHESDRPAPAEHDVRKGLTPEIRRLLGARRSELQPSQPGESRSTTGAPAGPDAASQSDAAGRASSAQPSAAKPVAASADTSAGPIRVRERETTELNVVPRSREQAPRAGAWAAPDQSRRRGAAIIVDTTTGRASAIQHIALVVGALILLAGTFYVGTRYPHWKNQWLTRKAAASDQHPLADKFLDAAAGDLVEQALAAEIGGDWRGAVDRLIAAKYKDRAHRGLLFRAGRILYEQGDVAGADKLFENAIQVGENIDASNYYRGLIASTQRNLPAAERFFAAAIAAEPLASHHYYSLAEALRTSGRPREAIRRYEQAALRHTNAQMRAGFRFKARIAQIEAGEAERLAQQIAEHEAAGPLSVDWLMTAAAAHIHQGRIAEAVPLIATAREGKDPSMFRRCASDMFFRTAAEKYPTVAKVTHLEYDPSEPAFR